MRKKDWEKQKLLNNMNTEKISNKFEIDIENEKLWYYIGSAKIAVDDDQKGNGQYNYQIFFQLDKEHKDHWINYAVKYSGGKVWVDFWYKKRIEDHSTAEGFKYINYKKRVEKLSNNVMVEFNYSDEYIKITDLSLLENKYKERGYKWVNRADWELKHGK